MTKLLGLSPCTVLTLRIGEYSFAMPFNPLDLLMIKLFWEISQ